MLPDNQSLSFIAAFLLLAVVVVAAAMGTRRRPEFRPPPDADPFVDLIKPNLHKKHDRYYRKRSLLTVNELQAFHYIRGKLPSSVFLCPCVRIADIIGVKWGKGYMSAFGRISQKHIDLVVMDFEGRMLFAVEVDDLSHERPDRRERDIFVDDLFRSVGLELIRVVPRQIERSEALRAALARIGTRPG